MTRNCSDFSRGNAAGFGGGGFNSISQAHALRIANAVKKSCQLFDLVFKRGKRPAGAK